MSSCMHCEATVAIERVTMLASTDGPVLLARWRCRADASHWWDAPTDAAPSIEPTTEAVSAVRARPSSSAG